LFIIVNRRLDEWVSLDRFVSMDKITDVNQHSNDQIATGIEVVDGGERKITRNQKRKHDAINHVQKVCSLFVG
jgi:histone acetyltransferase MYST1